MGIFNGRYPFFVIEKIWGIFFITKVCRIRLDCDGEIAEPVQEDRGFHLLCDDGVGKTTKERNKMQKDNLIRERLNIPYVKLKFRIVFSEDVILPKEKVSALRGGMGEMLLQQNCVMDRNCTKCPFEEECIVRRTMYTQTKEKPEFMKGPDSIGYLLECEDYHTEFQAGKGLFFYLVLFGKNIVYFSQYLQAFYRLGMCGIGKYGAKFYIEEIINQNGKVILRNNEVYMKNYEINMVYDYARKRVEYLKEFGYRNELVFHTPLCLKYHGEFLTKFCSEAIIDALFRRIRMLDYFMENYLDSPAISSYPVVLEEKSYFHSVNRFSSTQKSKMTLKGLKGSIRLSDIPEDILFYLLAGEILHIGKNTSFGFGRYVLQ